MWRVEGKYRGFKISAIFLFALIFYITYYQEPSDGFLFLPGAFGLLLLPIFEISFFFFLIARFPDFLDLTEMPECLRLE